MKKIIILSAATFCFVVFAYSQKTGSFTDQRDNKTYKWVKIVTQVWMAENLNYYTGSGSWCYDNKTSNCDKYGRLYNWETAKKSCPASWHLPTDFEWIILTDSLGGKEVAGGKMKSTSYWESPNTGATNSSGFTALPGGSSWSGSFYDIGSHGIWWSSTKLNRTSAWIRSLESSTKVYLVPINKACGFSVRCIKD